ncbi:DNA glycosylase AlkZ-like family protein [Microbacterium halotolerans]|uniref:DNA glycosylase AlkZ-like family protein n=1 Tax=Microbacterium halotolerans TaxID=246613 RepID=UPI000E6AB07A|nr:crosslink repair DNA glycosylase YcaQ family protein [Microbacterium halotolerans]
MQTLTLSEARSARWGAQLLGGSELTPVEVVDRAVALQGQDLPAVLRAIAMRSRPGTTVDDVRGAFDQGELVRSWPVRGTLFATTPAHLAALLSLTGERIHRSTVRRRAELGLDDGTVALARKAALDALSDGGLTRAELLAVWNDAGIDTTGGRGYHLIVHHAVSGAWHWGPFRGEEQLLTRTTDIPAPSPDPLLRVIRGLVTARGPVTEADLVWWLKLPKTPVRRAIAAADLTEIALDGGSAWIADEPAAKAPSDTFAPAFDEWILGYQDRSLTASSAMQTALVPGGNGVFRPTVIVDGVTVGTWQGRSRSRREPSLELVEKVPAATCRRLEAALAAWPHA